MKNLLLIFTLLFLTVVFSSLSYADWTKVREVNNKMLLFSSYFNTQLAHFHKERKRDRRSKRRSRDNKRDVKRMMSLKPCTACKTIDGFVPMNEVSNAVRIMVGKSINIDKAKAVDIQRLRGALQTGLYPDFIDGANCPEIDSEKWAIDYSYKRPWPAIHKGIDIPQTRGTPILAISNGTVVGKFINKGNRKGIEVMLRHSPKQTGLTFWTYSQYTHLFEMSPLAIGQSVKIGQKIGKTGNTGKMGQRIRRDALHFAILYSNQPEWSNDGRFVTPKGGYWMDPNAFYRLKPPYDSKSLKVLQDNYKAVPVSYMKLNGSFVPQNTKRIWPFPCD